MAIGFVLLLLSIFLTLSDVFSFFASFSSLLEEQFLILVSVGTSLYWMVFFSISHRFLYATLYGVFKGLSGPIENTLRIYDTGEEIFYNKSIRPYPGSLSFFLLLKLCERHGYILVSSVVVAASDPRGFVRSEKSPVDRFDFQTFWELRFNQVKPKGDS